METTSQSNSRAQSREYKKINSTYKVTVEKLEQQRLQSDSLIPHFAFGFHKKGISGIFYLNADHLIYALGKRIVVAGFRPKEMTFFPEYDTKIKKIITFALSPNRKLLAVAEQVAEGAYQVYQSGNLI